MPPGLRTPVEASEAPPPPRTWMEPQLWEARRIARLELKGHTVSRACPGALGAAPAQGTGCGRDAVCVPSPRSGLRGDPLLQFRQKPCEPT